MSTEGPQVRDTIVAANDFRVANALYKVVNEAGNFCAADDAFGAGVALSQPNSGQHLAIGRLGIFKAYIGAAINSSGTRVSLAASGFLAAATSGDTGVGATLETGASGDLVRCFLNFAQRSTVA